MRGWVCRPLFHWEVTTSFRSDSEFCKEGVFTLTTEFNKGAVQCDCNVDGSLNFNCQSFGGQCQCRDNVIGRTCSACRPDYYGFPNCKRKFVLFVRFFLLVLFECVLA